jgi:hypothetical protein
MTLNVYMDKCVLHIFKSPTDRVFVGPCDLWTAMRVKHANISMLFLILCIPSRCVCNIPSKQIEIIQSNATYN